MKLSLYRYLLGDNPTLPVRVIGNGYETSNVPEGTLATVTKFTGRNSFQIVWDHLPDPPEIFNIFGGMAMTLDVTMTARIKHFYGKTPPVPEAIQIEENFGIGLYRSTAFYVDLENIQDFAEKHGNIILSPPGQEPHKDQWFIYVTDETGKFKAR